MHDPWILELGGTEILVNYKTLVLVLITLSYLWDTYLNLRQHWKLLSKTIPPSLLKHVKQSEFHKSRFYSLDKSWYNFFSGIYNQSILTFAIYFNVLARVWDYSAELVETYLDSSSEIAVSLLFITVLGFAMSIANLPFSLYYTFHIEQKHGFNRQTLSLYFIDVLKTIVMSMVIGLPFVAGFLSLVMYFGADFYIYVWGFFFVFQLFLNTIYPTVIQPLFNKFTPMEEGNLKVQIEQLAQKIKFPLDKIYVIDGSKRSAHSNAYFFGLFRSKGIVIFDTLLSQTEEKEVLAILGHELGHWKLNHIWKRLLAVQVHFFMLFYLFSLVIGEPALYTEFGFKSQPVLVGFLLFQFIYTPVETVAGFLMNVLSRQHEFEADRFAKKLGYAEELKAGLIKISVKNLGNLNPDRLYSIMHYTHPTLVERLAALDKSLGKSKSD